MYCTVSEVKSYLNITASTDDALLSVLVSSAQQRIEDYTKRKFEATSDTVRYFDAVRDVNGRTLELDEDLSHITSIDNNGSSVPSTEYTPSPRNVTPWHELKIKSGSSYYWAYTNDPEDAISITGRWAAMLRKPILTVSRSTNVVTATMSDTSGLAVGQRVQVVAIADSTFNGGFTLTAVTDTSVTWAQTASNDTDTTGYILFTPPSIRQACIRLTAWLYRQKDNQQGDIDRPILAGDGNVIMPTTLPQDVQALLREWVRIL